MVTSSGAYDPIGDGMAQFLKKALRIEVFTAIFLSSIPLNVLFTIETASRPVDSLATRRRTELTTERGSQLTAQRKVRIMTC